MKFLFDPRSVAIYGASNEPQKIGGRPLHMMKTGGFMGALYPINAARSEVQGLRSYPSVSAVDGPVDLAIIAVPAGSVLQALQECADKGVPGAIVFSSGFSEIGGEGVELQRQVTRIAHETGMRILGPNCLGVVDIRTRMLGTFSNGPAGGGIIAGRVSLASQSGAFGSYCLSMFRQRKLGLNKWITTGNQADIEISDCIHFLAQDDETDVIMGYLEAVKDSKRLYEALALARDNGKRVVVMKVGSSTIGASAAASHTASLAGADQVYDAVFREYGVHRAHTIEEMFDVGYASAAVRHLPAGKRIGLLTVSGGVGVHMADEAERLGLDVAPMPADAQAKLKALVPFAATANPVDVTAQLINDHGLVKKNLELMLDQGGYHAVVGFLSTVGIEPELSRSVLAQLPEILARFPDRLIIVSMLSTPEVREQFEAAGVLVFDDPARALRATAALMNFGAAARAQVAATSTVAPAVRVQIPQGQLNEVQAKQILSAAGIPVLDEVLAQTEDAAVYAASGMGYPVVLKIVAPQITHKSDIGGVALDIPDEPKLRKAWQDMMAKVKATAPEATIDGAIVAPMLRGGVETIMGVSRDPVFGPVVMFGMGGVFVEALKDITFRVAPFGVEQAHEMISRIRSRVLLKGFRGQPSCDENALAHALSRLSAFAFAHADVIESIDINPFVVLPEGSGAVALDALIVTGSDAAQHREAR